MTLSDYKHMYWLGLGLIILGSLVLLGTELAAAYIRKQSGDTISELVWAAEVPGFIIMIVAGINAIFGLSLAVHFIARGKWGL